VGATPCHTSAVQKTTSPAALAFLALTACSSGGGDQPTPDAGFGYTGTPGTPVNANFGFDLLADVAVQIGTNPSHLFTVDTGAPFVLLDSTIYTDHVPGVHTGETLKTFNLTISDVTEIAQPIPGDDPPGIVGGDLLKHFAYTLDYVGNRAWLSDPFNKDDVPADVAAGNELDVPFDIYGGGSNFLAFDGCTGANCHVDVPATRILLQATFEDAASPVWVLLDSGSSLVVLDPAVFAALADDPNRPTIEGASLGGVSGESDAFYTRVWRVKMNGSNGAASEVSVDNVVSAVIPGDQLLASLSEETGKPVKALLGGAFFRYFLTTVDYQKSMVRLSRYVDPQIDPTDWIGPGFSIDLNDNTAVAVYTNKSAAAQGLQNGDTILSIGSLMLAGQSQGVIVNAFLSYSLGDTMPITFSHNGGQTMSANVMVENLLPDYPPPS
jgi:hypothetical protein